jgi:hypothetical protein
LTDGIVVKQLFIWGGCLYSYHLFT